MTLSCTRDVLVMIKGAGDVASGVALRLRRCGFRVVMTELPEPLMVRRTVSFGEAVYEGETTIEGILARRVEGSAAARATLNEGVIPVLVDPEAGSREDLCPAVLVDGIMAKHNTGTALDDAPLVVALGPGFTAGVDCRAVIETNRGHWLGRVIWEGSAQPDTATPGTIAGRSAERVLRAPVSGILRPQVAICTQVTAGQVVATVEGHELRAQIAGVLRGMAYPGLPVTAGMKVGDVDPRAEPAHCFAVSDKCLAIGGGVLEAILSWAAAQTQN